MSTARKILGSTISQFVGKLLVGLLSIVIIRLLTRYLSQEQYGNYNFIYDFLAVFGIIADLGLYTVAVREMSKDESKIPVLLGNVLTIRTVVGVLAMLFAVIVGFLIPVFMPEHAGSGVSVGIAIASVTILLALLNSTLTSILQVHYRMRESAVALVVGKIISIAYVAYAVLIAFTSDPSTGFYHVIAAGILGNAGMLLCTWWYTRRITEIKYRFDWKLIREVFVKALPYGLALMLSTIYFRLNTILLFRIKGSEEVALYSVGMRLIESLIVISLYFMNSVLPVLTKSIESRDDKHESIIQNAFDFLAVMGFAIVSGGYVLAYPIIAIVSDPKYLSRFAEGVYGSDIGLQILVFALMFSFINTLFSFVLISVNQQKRLLWINIGAIVVNLIINALVIPQWGFRGAAMTSVIAELYILAATYSASRHYLKYHLRFGNIFKIIMSSVVMGIVVFVLREPLSGLIGNKNLLVLIPVGGAMYAGMLFATGVLSREKIRSVLRKEQPEIVPTQGE
ncbi:MAG: flippase [Candidatus Gracilibacteria bacterium]